MSTPTTCVNCGRHGTRAFTPGPRPLCTNVPACERRARRREGMFTLAAGDYHQDPAPEPSLNKTSAHLICTRSAAHAAAAHPRLNPDQHQADSSRFDVGIAAHAILLEGDDRTSTVHADSWRSKAAQDQRDEIRAAGRIPLLARDATSVQTMVRAVRRQLATRHDDPPLLADGKPEQTLLWRERDVWCRARPDWLRTDHTAIDDLKTTSGSADPHQWARTRLWDIGADLQAAMYSRGVQALTGRWPLFRLIVVETEPPYALSVLSLSPSALELARRKLEHALAVWRQCLQTRSWPGYPPDLAYVELPGWLEGDWLQRTWTDERQQQGLAA